LIEKDACLSFGSGKCCCCAASAWVGAAQGGDMHVCLREEESAMQNSIDHHQSHTANMMMKNLPRVFQ
jgi:hypothetical protein